MVEDSFWLLFPEAFPLSYPFIPNKVWFTDTAKVFVDYFTESTLVVGILVRKWWLEQAQRGKIFHQIVSQ